MPFLYKMNNGMMQILYFPLLAKIPKTIRMKCS